MNESIIISVGLSSKIAVRITSVVLFKLKLIYTRLSDGLATDTLLENRKKTKINS